MVKVPFSNKIDEQIARQFEQLCSELGPPRYRILEAAIEVFQSLPREFQLRLKAPTPEDRQPCLDAIAKLSLELKHQALADDIAARANADKQRRNSHQQKHPGAG